MPLLAAKLSRQANFKLGLAIAGLKGGLFLVSCRTWTHQIACHYVWGTAEESITTYHYTHRRAWQKLRSLPVTGGGVLARG